MSTDNLTPWSVLRDGVRLIARFVRVHPAAFTIAVLGAAVYAGAILGSSVVMGWVTDVVIIPVLDEGASYEGLLVTAGALILGVATVKAVGIVVRRTAAGWLTFKTRQDVRNELLSHQLALKMSWFSRQNIGDLLAVADSDVDRGTDVLSPLPYGTGVSLLLVGAIAMIFAIDPWLGLGALVGLVIVIAIDIRGSWITYVMWEEVQKSRGRVSAAAHESFDGALTVKALGRETYVSRHFRVVSDGLRDRLIQINSTWTNYQVVIRALPQALIIILVAAGAARVAIGDLTAGNVITVAYLLALLAFPIQLVGFVLWDIAGSRAGWQRVQAVFDADEYMEYGEQFASEAPGPAPVSGGSVGFAYDEEPILQDLHLDLEAGTTVAVVGATASGKSTLALLLARLWDPGTGDIALDGRDLRSFASSELPKEVSYVSQDAFLFDDTVRGNITLGAEFSEDEIAHAVRFAGAKSFVSDLPKGLDTQLGERGTTLSGGQRQRIALARALIRKPRLLILDDATSAVDPSVEAEILRSLKGAALPSTVVVVAYRPATIRLADEVVFVDQKKVMGHGRHEELLNSSPGYVRLVQAYEEDALRLSQEAS